MIKTEARKSEGAKMQFLIKRKAATTREQLVAHWFANHMPRVMERNDRQEAAQEPFFRHYLVSLFDAHDGDEHAWDGVAQLWFDAPTPRPATASGVVPTDSFHEKVEPYWPWATQEWIAVEGSLPVEPLTLDAPYPCSRSGFLKQTSLVAARPGVDLDDMFAHWLGAHVTNVMQCLEQVGGLRYVVSLSTDLEHAPYAGMAELYFPDAAARTAFWDIIQPDGFQDFVDAGKTRRFTGATEFIGR
ncbi:MAG: EthD domain-containing protein [Pseudomonadota bacterium]